jgi:hypothetical protein
VPSRANRDRETSLPSPRTELQFRGFPEFRSNVLYCPKQFFTVVIPNSSVNCIRVVAYMLRKTLGWVDESGEPIQERHEFSYREFEERAGIVQSALQKAVDESLKSRFVRRAQRARIQKLGIHAKTAAYELLWDEHTYTDDLATFQGLYMQSSYVDDAGQNRIGRKNIPNVFFDYVIRQENRALIRVVGTLLWYSIDWGKGGERRTTVKKSLRDLVGLTLLAKGSVVRALDEAIEKGYIERVEPGVFDLAGNQHGSVTVYGIKWTKDYTYTAEGLLEAIGTEGERFKNETRPAVGNASKMRHGKSEGTLQKRDTENQAQRFKNETRNASKTRHGERFKNETIRTTNSYIPNTLINNSSSSAAPRNRSVAAAEEALLKAGFDKKTAAELASTHPAEIIFRQINSLPRRRSTKNPFGMLRQAIVEDWAVPPEPKTTDVGSFPGKTFAANFYAGYHGNSEAPVSDPSPADSEAAEKFVKRLFEVSANAEEVPTWAREFGMLVARSHGQKRQSLPALRLAIQRHGDDFYARFRESCNSDRRRAVERDRQAHYEEFQASYQGYLREELARHEGMNSTLFQTLLAEEREKLKDLETSRMGWNRVEHFQQLVILEEGHGVLDFWAWDKALNPESLREAGL